MNRLGKILTLGLERKRAWQLPIIAGLLLLFGLGVRWWYNSRAARGVRLLDMVDINDVDGVRWILKWDREQVNEEGEVTRLIGKGPFGWAELDTEKFYPLLLAVEDGRTGIVKVLIEAGAKVNATREGGWPPLHYTAYEGQIEVVKMLLNAGAGFNTKDRLGNTLLHGVALKGETEVAKMLIQAGAEVNAKNENGCAPLYWAVDGGNTEMVKILLKAGAEVNTKVQSGFFAGLTPLHRAAQYGQTEAAKLLLKSGANVNAKDKAGRTPLDVTKKRQDWLDPKDQAECADLLRKHGAKTGAELDAEAKQGKPER